MCSKEKMKRVNASRVVAPVAHNETFRDNALVGEHPRKAVSLYVLPTIPEDAVSIFVNVGRPRPTWRQAWNMRCRGSIPVCFPPKPMIVWRSNHVPIVVIR